MIFRIWGIGNREKPPRCETKFTTRKRFSNFATRRIFAKKINNTARKTTRLDVRKTSSATRDFSTRFSTFRNAQSITDSEKTLFLSPRNAPYFYCRNYRVCVRISTQSAQINQWRVNKSIFTKKNTQFRNRIVYKTQILADAPRKTETFSPQRRYAKASTVGENYETRPAEIYTTDEN